MRLLSQINNGQACCLSAHSPTPGTRALPLYVGYVSSRRVFSVISSLPSSLSADEPCIFSELNTHPTYSPVYASSCTSRCPTQNSGPSGSLVLSRKNFAFSASCRFSPAHCNGDIKPIIHRLGGTPHTHSQPF